MQGEVYDRSYVLEHQGLYGCAGDAEFRGHEGGSIVAALAHPGQGHRARFFTCKTVGIDRNRTGISCEGAGEMPLGGAGAAA